MVKKIKLRMSNSFYATKSIALRCIVVLCIITAFLAFHVNLSVFAQESIFSDSGQRLGNAHSFSAVLGDLDGDGDLDAFIANSIENKVWFNSGGNQKGAAGTFIDSGQKLGDLDSWAVALGDLDGDGDLDAFIANEDSFPPFDELQNKIWLNEGGVQGGGQGTFIDSGQSLGDAQSHAIVLGDLDGDGDLDAFVGNWGEPNKVWLNQGGIQGGTSGTFIDSGQSLGNAFSETVALGDLDGDGDLDAFVGNWGEPNKVWLNQGGIQGGTPGTFIDSGQTLGDFSTTDAILDDLDGDGDLDAFITNGEREPNKVWLNQGGIQGGTPGTFIDSGQLLGDSFSEAVALGDLDGDGDLDASVANSDERNKIWLNQGGIQGGTPGTFIDSGQLLGESFFSFSVALGDLDGDGDLDTFISNFLGAPNEVWFNELDEFFDSGQTLDNFDSSAVVLGDIDSDKDLDAIVTNSAENKVWLNEGGIQGGTPGMFIDSGQLLGDSLSTDAALGDLDGDGDLDIFIGNLGQPNKVWLNEGGIQGGTPGIFIDSGQLLGNSKTLFVTLGDLDGDGDLDAFSANREGEPNKVWLNEGGIQGGTPGIFIDSGQSLGNAFSETVALGDLDGDGDLDALVGNWNQPNKVWLNEGGIQGGTPGIFIDSGQSLGDSFSFSVVLGDLDGDGDLDTFVANLGQANKVWLNEGGIQGGTPGMFIDSGQSLGNAFSETVALGDLDGDGDLDAFVANSNEKNKIWLNEGGIQGGTSGMFIDGYQLPENLNSQVVALGDLNLDGDLDAFVGNRGQLDRVYLGQFARIDRFKISLHKPGQAQDANFVSTPIILTDTLIPFTYTLFHPTQHSFGQISSFYSLTGGGSWEQMIPTNSVTISLTATPQETPHVFTWDTFSSSFFGQSDNVVIRSIFYPNPPASQMRDTYRYTNTIAGPYQWPYASATTFPFRARGTQVRVVDETGQPQVGALVYKLSEGESHNGCAIGNGVNSCIPPEDTPFVTDAQGYLQGRGRIDIGDRLLALAPVDWTETMTWAVGLTDTLHLYYTNDTNSEGVPLYTVTEPGVQTLVVRETNPLMLFDLDVSLEWDASSDTSYIGQLEDDLKKASKQLFDFTDGQVALRQITVYQDKTAWDTAHVQVRATNRLRPFAIQGGVVLTDTVDPHHNDIYYRIGQVVMGSTWNRYGDPGKNLGDDWSLALAHELAHFFLFLDDTYLGLNEDGLLIAIDTENPAKGCIGTAMGDVYSVDNSEFIFDDVYWADRCAQTLTERTLERDEWETITLWYPPLKTPTEINPGPNLMPFDLTNVIFAPIIPINPLVDPTFFLDYEDGTKSSSRGTAFLLREHSIVDLGSPVGGQNRLLARGARPDDRLCTFDPDRQHYGCEVIELGDERLTMKFDSNWTPFIQLTPVNSTTYAIQVENVPADLSLKAKLFPEADLATEAIMLTPNGSGYQGQFPPFTYTVLAGHVQLWVDEIASEDDPRREAVVAFSIGGNPPKSRGSGPKSRGSGPKSRGSGAPIVSSDGQFIFFTPNPEIFKKGEFYTVQDMAALPALPSGKKAIGPGYNLVAFPQDLSVSGSVSFQYLGQDALVEEVSEDDLTIHFWDGTTWQALDTYRDTYYNLASASFQKPGVYALLAGITSPDVTTFTPMITTNDLTITLVITGQNFLSPTQIRLIGNTTAYTLSAQVVSSTTMTTALPKGLPAQAYQLIVINGDQGYASTSDTLAIFEPNDEACFYDNFESGPNKWQLEGEWGIVTLKDGLTRAMTDSPDNPYPSSSDSILKRTTTITSPAISLQNCSNPKLSFKQDFDILNFKEDWGESQDFGFVEISTSIDGGGSWSEWINLRSFFNGGAITPLETENLDSAEWSSTDLYLEEIDMTPYITLDMLIQLRFSLEADAEISGKGWVIDDVIVTSGLLSPPPPKYSIFLPLIMK